MAVSRKTVTVLFADLADSTGLGERFDAELVRGLLSRWFEEARAIVEGHGGTVEKFIGDAVMAVFGVPRTHEDDALRAVRAASELRASLGRLNEGIDHERGMHLAVRVGVNTGEVVTGGADATLVTGDAVNVAKRLEEAARGGEVLVGVDTERLTRSAAQFEIVGPVSAKGKSSAVEAWRLVGVEVHDRAVPRTFDTPLVGRRAELLQLERAYGHAVGERACCRFTLLGPAGIGKSRLTAEFFDGVADEATILVGRCLPYGDGITFWPLAQVLRDLGTDDEIRDLLVDEDDADLVHERLCGITGRSAIASQETFWATRRLCETLARARPLVLCFEDVHWAETTFLDLIEYLAGWSRNSPILVLCVARPEFVDERPAWLAAGNTTESLMLSPLSATDSEALVDSLGVPPEARDRIVGAAEGNPLYAEQMAAMVAEGGYADGLFAIPPTIQALLAARLDRLSTDERNAIERAAVCGKEFWRGAVSDLTMPNDRDRVTPALMSLVRKELVRPQRSAARPDDAFRFSHVLIRDAAYAASPKETRALLHEQFADWVEANMTQERAELDEIIGYHLEQAYRYREQLGLIDDHARALAARACDLLGQAGRRAFERDDTAAAVKLLDRAVALATRENPARLELMRQLSGALWSIGEVARAEVLLNGLIDAAEAVGDRRYESYAVLQRAAWRMTRSISPSGWDEVVAAAEQALAVFTREDDDAGLAQAWRSLAMGHHAGCRFEEATRACELALRHARAGNATREESRAADLLCMCLVEGPTPVNAAILRIVDMLDGAGANQLLEANVRTALAELRAMQCRFGEARALYRATEGVYENLGVRFALAGLRQVAGAIELYAGNPAEAERLLRSGYELLPDVAAVRAYHGLLLASALYGLGRYDEAQRFTDEGEELARAGGVVEAVTWARIRGPLLARAGCAAEGEQVIRDAMSRAEETDALNVRGRALVALAEVLQLKGDAAEARDALQRAIAVFDRKRNLAARREADAMFGERVTR